MNYEIRNSITDLMRLRRITCVKTHSTPHPLPLSRRGGRGER